MRVPEEYVSLRKKLYENRMKESELYGKEMEIQNRIAELWRQLDIEEKKMAPIKMEIIAVKEDNARLKLKMTPLDYALLRLKEEVHGPVFNIFPDFSTLKRKVTVCGYPFKGHQNNYQWKHSNSISFNHSKDIGFYDIDTERGQSGSPVYFTDNKSNCYVVGIHKGISVSRQYNTCTMLTSLVLNKLNGWAQDMGLFSIIPER